MTSYKYKVLIALYSLLFFFRGVSSLDVWILPDENIRYNATCFLTSHNAFANFNEGWGRYMMQTWSIEEQLDHGVRGLMLDVFNADGSIVMCHGGCGPLQTVQKGVRKSIYSLFEKHEYKRFSETLKVVKEWVERHPAEIVTIFLENRVDIQKLNDEIKSVEGLAPFVLTLREWDPADYQGSWPRLAWMRNTNKRIVIFNEDKTGSGLKMYGEPVLKKYLFYYGWHYIIESQYGTVDPDKACVERTDSQEYRNIRRTIYVLNFFRTLAGPLAQSVTDNSYEMLKKTVQLCQSRNLAHGKTPNFIALDFVEEGNAIKLINELNERKKIEGKA